ncbi:MAG: signal recognition particle receptor subunit alpha, partial [Chlamydiia bacterium]|nr:signal recognition particle receptor subunit alpha [Chlamydiia bacterium]
MIFNLLKGGYSKVRTALSKTRSALGSRVRSLLGRTIDEDVLEELEEIFYEADLGVQTSIDLVERVRKHFEKQKGLSAEEALEDIRSYLVSLLSRGPSALGSAAEGQKPSVILVVGANGNGKTTTIAKLAKRLVGEGKKVLLVAGDTFRAAAVEQLELWAKRLDVDIVRGSMNSDPSAVAFDALQSAVSKGHDVVIIDTAGRLHTKTPLMQELNKIKRTCQKVVADSPHETLLVLDTSIGQN